MIGFTCGHAFRIARERLNVAIHKAPAIDTMGCGTASGMGGPQRDGCISRQRRPRFLHMLKGSKKLSVSVPNCLFHGLIRCAIDGPIPCPGCDLCLACLQCGGTGRLFGSSS